jgi:hypothetical protein
VLDACAIVRELDALQRIWVMFIPYRFDQAMSNGSLKEFSNRESETGSWHPLSYKQALHMRFGVASEQFGDKHSSPPQTQYGNKNPFSKPCKFKAACAARYNAPLAVVVPAASAANATVRQIISISRQKTV